MTKDKNYEQTVTYIEYQRNKYRAILEKSSEYVQYEADKELRNAAVAYFKNPNKMQKPNLKNIIIELNRKELAHKAEESEKNSRTERFIELYNQRLEKDEKELSKLNLVERNKAEAKIRNEIVAYLASKDAIQTEIDKILQKTKFSKTNKVNNTPIKEFEGMLCNVLDENNNPKKDQILLSERTDKIEFEDIKDIEVKRNLGIFKKALAVIGIIKRTKIIKETFINTREETKKEFGLLNEANKIITDPKEIEKFLKENKNFKLTDTNGKEIGKIDAQGNLEINKDAKITNEKIVVNVDTQKGVENLSKQPTKSILKKSSKNR